MTDARYVKIVFEDLLECSDALPGWQVVSRGDGPGYDAILSDGQGGLYQVTARPIAADWVSDPLDPASRAL